MTEDGGQKGKGNIEYLHRTPYGGTRNAEFAAANLWR